MKKKTKLTPEFWKRDAENRRELAERVVAIDARRNAQAQPERPQR